MTNLRRIVVAGLAIVTPVVAIALIAGGDEPRPASAAAPPAKYARTPQRLERGRHLFHNVSNCVHCHSEIDWTRDGGPPVEGRIGAGVSPFYEDAFAWLSTPNITPDPETGIGAWTDEQIERAVRQGVRPDGRVLFPLMPYQNFNGMSDEDIASLIVYLRSLAPVKHKIKPNVLPEPLLASLKPLPKANGMQPDRSNPLKHGEYLVRMASCAMCHTPVNARGEPRADLAFGGGLPLEGPWGKVVSANLTQDPSGICYYDEARFIDVLRRGHVGARELSDIMPWAYFARMSDAELKAIWAYLKTLPHVKHRVDNTSRPTPCPRCGGTHGLGNLNDEAK